MVVLCRGMRSGTLPTPLAVGLGAACEVARKDMEVSVWPHILLYGVIGVRQNKLCNYRIIPLKQPWDLPDSYKHSDFFANYCICLLGY